MKVESSKLKASKKSDDSSSEYSLWKNPGAKIIIGTMLFLFLPVYASMLTYLYLERWSGRENIQEFITDLIPSLHSWAYFIVIILGIVALLVNSFHFIRFCYRFYFRKKNSE